MALFIEVFEDFGLGGLVEFFVGEELGKGAVGVGFAAGRGKSGVFQNNHAVGSEFEEFVDGDSIVDNHNNGASSPAASISQTMSQPPISSPLM